MTEAKPKDYWISPTALRITLNALSDADYIQATAASGAMVLCYMKGIEGLEYDNGHNYKRWPLKISQTYFTTTSKKYVYIRIPRAGNSETDTAMVVFPSEHIDLYGATEDGRQIGNAGYYYIWTQGIISASEPSNEGLRRHWEQNMVTGTLDSDEALDSGGTGEWWEYNPTTDMVTFLKKIAHGEFEELLADYLEADQTVTDLVVSRNYLSGPDGAGFRLIRNAGNDVSELETDRITAREKMYGNWLQSSDYTGEGMLDTGFRLWYENGRSKLVIDDIVARGKFSVYELESRIMTHAGGDVCFSSAGSKLFYVEYLDASGEPMGYTTINSPWMLRDKFLLAGVSGLAAWANRRKIQRQLTPEQKTKVTKFRCYVFSDDGTMKTRNWWRVHDLARCQTFDHTQMKQTAEGYYSGDNVSNTVYWRRVAGIGSKRIEALGDNKIYDYFDLWNVLDVSGEKYVDAEGVEHVIGYDIPAEQYTTPGYDASWNDWPAAGDDVVQFGNARDVDRQAVNVLQVTGGEPGLKVYHGIHDYRTDNTKWVDIGYDAGLQRAKADVFGDFYFGARGSVDPRDGSTYVRYNAARQLLEIKARISAQSTYGDSDKSLYDYVRDNIWTPSEIEGMIGEGVEVVQNQLDGNFTIWYGEVTPTLSNYPANQWNTAAKKKEHLYDMYYNKANGYGYRFVSETSGGTQVYKWERVGDSSILASLAAAAAAQDTADGKRRVFLVQPVPPYDEGDLWVNASYTSPITHEVIFDNDIVKCVTAKPNEESTDFDAHDWTIASKYTDDSALTSFVNGTYKDFVDNIQAQVDKKAETWYQATDPSANWTTAALKAEHVGDIWMNTSAGGGKKTYIYQNTGTAQSPVYQWKEQNVPDDVFDKIDGKADIFVSKPTTYNKFDLWIIESGLSETNMPAGCQAGDIVIADNLPSGTTKRTSYNKSDWRKKDRYTDDSALTSFVNGTYKDFVDNIQTQVDKKAETWYQATDPSANWTTAALKAEHVGDIWMNTSAGGGKKTYIYQNTGTAQSPVYQWKEQNVPDDVFDKIDGKADIFVSKPTTYNKFDLWIIESGLSETNMPAGCQAGDIVIADNLPSGVTKRTSYNKSDWRKKDRYTDDSALTSFVNGTYKDFVDNIQAQVDKKAETWYQATDPSANWTTAALKAEHVGDIWMNTSADGGKKTYIYQNTGTAQSPVYQWKEQNVPDDVFDKIDGKADIFVSKPTTYNKFDLWIIESGLSETNMPAGCQTGDIVIADNLPSGTTKRTSYNKSDWRKKDRYTDDSALTSFVNGTYKDFVDNIQTQVDGKAETWYQTTDPSTGWSDTEKTEHIGDIWHNSSSQTINGVEAGQDAIWNGTSWKVSAVPKDVFDKIDGKADIFVSKPTTYNQFDLWIIESGLSATDMPSGCQAGDIVISSQKRTNKYTKSDWTKKDRYTDDSKFDNFFNTTYKDFVDNIQTQVDGKAETWYQDSDPSTAWTTASVRAKHVGDIWMDLRENQGHNTYIYVDKGEGQNPRYKWEAQEVPSDVFDMIDGKAAIYVNAVSSPPANYQANDLWILPAVATINSVSYKKGEVLTATNDSETYVASHWVKKVCYTDDSAFNSYINQVLNGTGASGDTATVADAARVLNGALKAKTEMDGGLMLTSTLVMRKKDSGGSYTTWGGLNGVYSSGTTIAAWFGGGMIDHEASPSATGYATSLFRMNGSGYVAKGNITWDDDGKVTIQGNTLKTANFYLNGNDVTSILGDLLGMFELDTTTQPGTTLIKAKYSLYSVGDVSALGAGSSGGGGGGGGASTLDELNDVTIASLIDGQALVYDISSRHWKNKTIAQALASLTDVNLSGLQNGQVLIYNSSTQKWKPGSPGKVNQVMLGTVAYDPTSGVVSLPAYPTSLPASDVSAWAKAATKPSYTLDEVNDGSTRKLSNYLPKSGGAMTGIITRDAGGGWIKARDNAIIKTVRTSGQGADWHPAVAIKTSSGCWSFGSVGGETLAISYDTDANYNAENNEAAAIYFPSAGSTGTLALTSQLNDYLPKSGGTLTGLLKISTGDGITDASGNGMLCYHPSDWSGVSASQWGVGAITCQGVIRSDNNPLKHYRPDGTYEIIDSKGGQSISSSLRVASLDIHNTNEINGVSNGNAHLNYASSGNVSIANGGGNVCIGGTSYSYKLTVSGSIYATGDVTAASDERKKEFVEYAVLTAEEIANAPAVKFRWKDGRDKDVHAGTYAQYWQKVLPEVVTDKDDTLGVNYGATAVVGLVNLAREVVELKKTVKEQRRIIDEQQKMMEEQRKMLLEMKAEIERLKKG